MYSSCAFFFAALDGLGPRYSVANAAYAVRLVEQATGVDLSPNFTRDLSIVADVEDDLTGIDLYQEAVSKMPNSAPRRGTSVTERED
jgi:hypothetical protein